MWDRQKDIGVTLEVHHLEAKIKRLPCWQTPISLEYLPGGLTNQNFLIKDKERAFVVRIADDIPEHGVWRRHELAASQAAHRAGISPGVFYSEPGVMVLDYIESKTLNEVDVRNSNTIIRIVELIKKAHLEIPKQLDIPSALFSAFQVNRYYLRTLDAKICHLANQLDFFKHLNENLESIIEPVNLVFGHNDLLAANFLDDGKRLWLIDWEYAGFNHPLFDLAGLASNNQFETDESNWLLEAYYQKPIQHKLKSQLQAMRCASILRETLWSLVSQQHSKLDIDYVAYADGNLTKLENEHTKLKEYGYE